MFKIKTLNKIAKVGLSQFPADRYQWGDDIESPDAILVRSASMHGMELPESLLAIARAGAGVNNIPIEECSKRGIVVFNTPGANANAVKELVIAGLLMASRRIVEGIRWAEGLSSENGPIEKQVEAGKGNFAGPEIMGKKLGVIGLGAIGVMVANSAHHLEMEVYGYDPYISVNSAWGLSRFVHHATSLNTLLTQCDYITLHVPLNPETRGMLGEEAFAMMKPGMRVLNFSRGELVDTDALKNALESGIVASYVTDFPNEQVLGLKNVVAIPHLGASTPESEDNCAVMAVRQLMDYLENGNIVNSVNLPEICLPAGRDPRVCVFHRNIPNMLSQISAALSVQDINIENMNNKSRGEYAYTILEVGVPVPESVVEKLRSIEGVLRVRTV